MPEKIWEQLQAVASGLRWLGKSDEAQIIDALATCLRDRGIDGRGEALFYLQRS